MKIWSFFTGDILVSENRILTKLNLKKKLNIIKVLLQQKLNENKNCICLIEETNNRKCFENENKIERK